MDELRGMNDEIQNKKDRHLYVSIEEILRSKGAVSTR